MCLLSVCTVFSSNLWNEADADWPRFRGPNGTGISSESNPTPVAWSEKENLKWKIPLPGAGVSSPIVVGDRVFVTCYSGYGVNADEAGGDISKLVRHLVCVDRATGKTLWERSVPSAEKEDPFSGMGVPQHGYASHTPVSDGSRVYVFFGKSGVIAFDLEGKELWRHSVGTGSDDRRWGSSSSPIVLDQLLVVTAGAESRSMFGLNKENGKELWKLESQKLGNVWGTPAIAQAANGKEIVIGAPAEIWGLDPATGQANWYCRYIENGDQFNSSVVVDGDTIYAIEGRGGGSVAVKAGGKDDVSDSKVVWKGRDSSQFSSPLVYDGRLYYFSRRRLVCLDAKTQEKIFDGRLVAMNGEVAPEEPARGGFGGPGRGGSPNAGGNPADGRGPGGPGGVGGRPGGEGRPGEGRQGEGRPGEGRPGGGGGFGGGRGGRGGGGFGGTDYASPVLADGKIYFVARNGEMYVLDAGREFKQLAVNRVTTETEDFSATPAISKGELFVRSNKHLYCVSAKK
jgi:outer membrane protein assembly factor BamB